MAAGRGNCYTCCLKSLISMGVSALIIWLSLRTQQPKCFIETLNITTTSHHHHSNNNNATIVFQLKLSNTNKDKGIQYDAVQVAFGVFLNANTTRPVGNATLDGFYQGHGKTAKKWGSAVAHGDGVNRTTVDGRLFLRVDFVTKVKYKIYFLFYTKRHRLTGGANVEVNVSAGEKVNPKDIRLGAVPASIASEAAEVRECCAVLVRFFVTVLFLTAFT
ncbi:protein NDR1-like [Gastrolobium bilobum]|uniref:protein NDR1-like n=1 Tax=Gastrolobium bilobum TaxID=150636 RepID=UPI002AB1EC2A|nr:protein NDR1-like [Gastrolobium bilobum]